MKSALSTAEYRFHIRFYLQVALSQTDLCAGSVAMTRALDELYGQDHHVSVSPAKLLCHDESPLSSVSSNLPSPHSSTAPPPAILQNDHSEDLQLNQSIDDRDSHFVRNSNLDNNLDSTVDQNCVPAMEPEADSDSKPSSPTRPRILRGRGNRLFGVLQSTLARANHDLEKDQPTITSRLSIHDRVRREKEALANKLHLEAQQRQKLVSLERNVSNAQRSLDNAQKHLDAPITMLRLTVSNTAQSGAKETILWCPGRHNDRTRRELQSQSEERTRSLELAVRQWQEKLEMAQEALQTHQAKWHGNSVPEESQEYGDTSTAMNVDSPPIHSAQLTPFQTVSPSHSMEIPDNIGS